MERLTYKTQDGWVGVNEQEDKTVSPTSVAIHKLCELEDVLEKWHIEDLDKFIENLIAKKRELNDILWRMEHELAELKQKAIVPQFKPNDDAYIIWNGTIIDVKISSIVTINEYIVKTCHSDLHHDGISCIDENEVFATKEEAEQKLAEIRGKDE